MSGADTTEQKAPIKNIPAAHIKKRKKNFCPETSFKQRDIVGSPKIRGKAVGVD
jgi:hypothetical protein